MKILRVITGFVAIFALGFIIYIFVRARDSVSVEKEGPVAASFVVSPDIPSSVSFCNKNIDLLRYNMHEGMDRELSSFMYFHSSTLMLIKRANRYFPVIEPVLKANGIPDDFKYLAAIESNLDPLATSPAHAVGMWQFLESTGKMYGLHITSTVDERRNVAKATEAACKYLRDAYNKYGDWVTVAASYNAGMKRVSDQIELQGESSALNLYLAEETMRYPYRIFALKQIFENPYKYGFILHPENLYSPIDCKEIVVNRDISDLIAFSHQQGITYYDLKFFNPWLRNTKLLTGGVTYKILIPNKKKLYYDSPNRFVHDRRWVVQ